MTRLKDLIGRKTMLAKARIKGVLVRVSGWWRSFEALDWTVVLVHTEQWRHEYNHVRPHSALNYRPPAPEAARPTFSVPGATSVS